MANNGYSKEAPQFIPRAGSVCLLVILLLLTWNTARFGLASLLSTYAAQNSQIVPANTAVTLSAGSPDAHYVRAAILEASDHVGAIHEHHKASLDLHDTV